MDKAEEEEKPNFPSAYKAFAYEWRQLHRAAIVRLTYIDVIRKIADDWSQLTPADKIVYWERAGVSKTLSQPNKKKKVTVQKNEDCIDSSKPTKKKSKSFSNLSTAGSDNSDDSDMFVQQKRKYRKRDKSWRSSDNDSHGNYGRRKGGR